MQAERDDLDDWIARLRGRIRRDQLRDAPPVKVGLVTMGAEQAARILLADVDHDRVLTLARRRDAFNVERRRHLLSQILRLREQIG